MCRTYLKTRVLSGTETIHSTKTLTRWATAKQFNISLFGKRLSLCILCLTLRSEKLPVRHCLYEGDWSCPNHLCCYIRRFSQGQTGHFLVFAIIHTFQLMPVNFNQAALRAVLKPKTCHRVHNQHKYLCTSIVCTLQVRFLLSPFPIVSVAVRITVFARFDQIYFNRSQNTGAKVFCI